MLSQNVAKTAVPSYYMIRTNLPQRKPQNQWEGVYYFSGLTKRQQHTILLQRKYARIAALKEFNNKKQSVEAALKTGQGKLKDGTSPYFLACRLADVGLYDQASVLVDTLHKQRLLKVEQYAQLIKALAAPSLQQCILTSEAAGDPSLVFKHIGDHAGEERAAEAQRWYEMGLSVLQAETAKKQVNAFGTSAATYLTNALMQTLLSCGFRNASAVPNSIYDRMGVLGISPTMSTYELVILGLSLTGNVQEAESVQRYIQQRHSEHMSIRSYNAILHGHREDRAYESCDRVWQQLFDSRWPRANVLTAELYLRSIVDHALTPVSAPLQRFGNLNVVEKKKVPLVLSQMSELGIPLTHLSRELTDEVEDALRKYMIHKNRFYEWGRAVKQFSFIEFRRRNGWMYDLHLMKNTTKSVPPVRDPSNPDASLAPAAAAELPAFFSERNPWEVQPLEQVLFVTNEKERTEDVRAGDFYSRESKSIHERSPTWMNNVPETRYDQLYGVNNPDISKVGIRRHLSVEYVNRKEVHEKDSALIRKSLSHGKRLRQRSELSRTHRAEGSLKGKK
ncbi:hypothetical protein AGDE_09004 [Angomonas deanei]|uniref:PPR repeat n=1 Tax=Angomonas deanei TaxID=59799 RepID=A0A7G2C195_9TRYP|nr:hypothetical protein AGDE_09004 [Angomonas deanei]CAD2213406.1 hypothetical protein, conserved [Angomonas deanei]|eukprot:EPY31534.1 hypothetical protein AGDE_09004 [Angomonas deanei]